MSRNLHLSSRHNGSVSLVQTPTKVTDEAMRLYDTGNTGKAAATHAITVYQRFLAESGWDREDLEKKIKEIETFLAFVPDARFHGY